MKNEEIKKALECCRCSDYDCEECPYNMEFRCNDTLCNTALTLITKQEKEIERLESENANLTVENEVLQSEKENLMRTLEEGTEEIKSLSNNYDPFWFCSFGGCEGVRKECKDLCEKSIFVQERKKTAKEILLPLRRFLIERFNYFGELAKRNEGVSPDNRLFDLGEQDMANCTLDRIKELLEKYGVEVEE